MGLGIVIDMGSVLKKCGRKNNSKDNIMRKLKVLSKNLFFFMTLGVIFCVSCATTVYYPTHSIVKKELTPAKKGVAEFTVFAKSIISPPPNVIVDYQTAYERGEKDTHKEIQNFCKDKEDSKYSVKSVSTEIRHSGWTGYTSTYYGYYSGFSTTNISPVYRKYTSIAFQCD